MPGFTAWHSLYNSTLYPLLYPAVCKVIKPHFLAEIRFIIHLKTLNFSIMEAVIFSKEQYTELMNRMDIIQSVLTGKQKDQKDAFLDNQEFIQLMNISKRTAQSWRDEGVISFSQVGSKIYYRMSDVQKLLDSNYSQAFKKRK